MVNLKGHNHNAASVHSKCLSSPIAAFLLITVGTLLVASRLHSSTHYGPPPTTSPLRFQRKQQHKRVLENNDEQALLSVANLELNSKNNNNETADNTMATYLKKKQSKQPQLLRPLPSKQEVLEKMSSLLDFAIVGFPKCGTTFLYDYLHTNESFVLRSEHCELSRNKARDLVVELYPSPAPGSKMGLKCPREIESEHAINNFAKFFYNTNFIVTMRHPIEWFESFYNFVAYQLWPDKLPAPEELIGPCQLDGSPYVCATRKDICPEKSRNLCTDRGNFHHALSRFGKTPMSTTHEMELLNYHNMSITPSKAKIFLVEIEQLNEEANPEKAKVFRDDLRGFLGLQADLPPMIRKETKRKEKAHRRNEFFIDICDDKHAELRQILLRQGRDASHWIRDFFIQSPDVIVSSPDYFIKLLKRWEQDPCQVSNIHISDGDVIS